MQSQMPMAIAADKLFPPIFGRQNKKGVAWFGLLLNAIIVTIFIGMNFTAGLVNQFQFLLLISVLVTLIPYLFSASAYLIVRLKARELNGRSLAIFIGFMAFIYSLWAIYGSGKDAVFYGFILMVAAIPFYIWMAYKKEV
jgi:APA family basic amino acid/polyamine antiporter